MKVPDLTPVCGGRALGFGLLYSPSVTGQDNLPAEIFGCNDRYGRLAGLAHLYGFAKLRALSPTHPRTARNLNRNLSSSISTLLVPERKFWE